MTLKRKRTEKTQILEVSDLADKHLSGSQWLQELGEPLEVYTPPTLPIPTTVKFYFVKEIVRKNIRELILMIMKAHESGFYVRHSSLKLDNIIFVDDVIKFQKLRVRSAKKSLCLQNFEWAADFIEATFFKNTDTKRIPLDMKAFIHLLRTYKRRYKPLVQNHFSLMNDKARRHVLAEWWQKTWEYDSVQWSRFEAACARVPSATTWPSEIDQNSPLYSIYVFRNILYKGDITDQICFFRNAVTHLPEYIWREDPKSGKYYQVFKYEDCEKIITCTFPKSIAAFQRLLHRENLMVDMKLEDYFC